MEHCVSGIDQFHFPVFADVVTDDDGPELVIFYAYSLHCNSLNTRPSDGVTEYDEYSSSPVLCLSYNSLVSYMFVRMCVLI